MNGFAIRSDPGAIRACRLDDHLSRATLRVGIDGTKGRPAGLFLLSPMWPPGFRSGYHVVVAQRIAWWSLHIPAAARGVLKVS
jgi:hypothetical protein